MSEKSKHSFSEYQDPNDPNANVILGILDQTNTAEVDELGDKHDESGGHDDEENCDHKNNASLCAPTGQWDTVPAIPVPVAAAVSLPVNHDEESGLLQLGSDGGIVHLVPSETNSQQVHAMQMAELKRERERVLQLIEQQEQRELERNKRSKKWILILSIGGVIIVLLIAFCLVKIIKDKSEDQRDDEDNGTPNNDMNAHN